MNVATIPTLKIFPRISKICLKILQLSQLDCTICNRPYLCVTESAQTKVKLLLSWKRTDLQHMLIKMDWNKLFTNPIKYIDPSNVAVRRCKWEKKDMKPWINSLKKYYSDIQSKMNPENNSMDQGFDYFLANPDNLSYLENEVNIYT